MCGAGKTLIAQDWELFGLALGNTRPGQLNAVPQTGCFVANGL